MGWHLDRDEDGHPTRLLYSRPAEPVATQVAVRESLNAKVRALFLSKPNRWIGVKALAKVGGMCGWRTRVSQVRTQLHAEDAGTIQWNGDVKDSRYRYLRQIPQGPDAAVPRERKLF